MRSAYIFAKLNTSSTCTATVYHPGYMELRLEVGSTPYQPIAPDRVSRVIVKTIVYIVIMTITII